MVDACAPPPFSSTPYRDSNLYPTKRAPDTSHSTHHDLPAQDDVQRAMRNAGQTTKVYLPQSVAAYLSSVSYEPSSDLTPPRLPFATDDCASTNLSTETQAGSIGPPHLDSPDLDNLSTLVHTHSPASLQPVTPLGSCFAENLVMPPGLVSPQPVDTMVLGVRWNDNYEAEIKV
ncbi:hypothetical protein DFH09DRAFT_1331488 [Mycena vulgaris]|nr:hypothetical protein DFH09DRAFT_1331488 [Mycena vulgaris]